MGVDYTQVGFYDQKGFVEAEQSNPTVLDKHADYVLNKEFDEDYIKRARTVIPEVTGFLFNKLKAAGKLSTCLDASMVLSRLLEVENIFNVIIQGAMTTQFAELKSPALHYRPFKPMMKPLDGLISANSWLTAPPFKIVDVTASLQVGVTKEEYDCIGGPILAEVVSPAKATLDDLVEPEYARQFLLSNGKQLSMELLEQLKPTSSFFRKIAQYGAVQVSLPKATLVYIPCRVTVPDLPIDGMNKLSVLGKTPKDILAEWKRQAADRKK